MPRRTPYKTPRTPQDRIAEARAAIRRLEAAMSGPVTNQFGEYGQNCRDAIAAHKQTIAEAERAIGVKGARRG